MTSSSNVLIRYCCLTHDDFQYCIKLVKNYSDKSFILTSYSSNGFVFKFLDLICLTIAFNH